MKLLIALLQILGTALISLPRWLQKVLGSFWGFLWIDLFRIRKKDVIKHVGNVFPNLTDKEKFKIARKSIYLLGYQIFDFFLLASIQKKWLDENVTIHGLENWKEAHSQGKGALLLTLHMGSPDIVLLKLAEEGIKPCLITKTFKSEFLTNLWFYLRSKNGAHLIKAHNKNNSYEILAALKNQESVVFVLDQYMGPPYGVETTFFGIKTGTAYGLSLFAKKTKAPVVPVYCIRTDDHKHHIYFEKQIPVLDVDDKQEYMTQMTQKYNSILEKIILKHPEQWMWVHRRWKKYLS